MIIILFLYKTLDDAKLFSQKLQTHTTKNKSNNDLYQIILEDIAESTSKFVISQDNNQNSIITFSTSNSFYNPFYSNVTYLISSNKNLLRIESLYQFDKQERAVDFYDKTYIDILKSDIESFKVIPKEDRYIFIIDSKNEDQLLFPTFKMLD